MARAWLATCMVAMLIASVAMVGVRAADSEDPDTIVLTDSNFDDVVNSHDLLLVEFYAPWCGHCKNLAPEYAKAATELKKNNPAIALAKCDATVATKSAGKFSISGYPTLKIFRNGKDTQYSGPRQHAGIVSYMKKQVGPSAKPLDSIAAVEEFIKSDADSGFAVVGFFEPGSKSSQLQSSFAVVSSKLRDNHIFGKVTDPAVAAHFGVTGEALVAFKTYDDGKTVYSGATKTKEVEDWIKAHSLPVVGEMTETNQEQYMKRELPILKFFVNVDKKSNPKQYNFYVNRLKKVAQDYAGKLLVATLHMPLFEQAVQAFGLKGKQEGAVIEKGYQNKYKMDGAFSAKTLEKFAADFFADELDEYVKSEDVPKDNSGPVVTVVGKNFDKIVNDPTKDVLIEFYAPWCGHCKSLAPKYEQLGSKFKGVDSVVVAKIDATANDFPREDFKVSGYPTIFFVPAKAGASATLYEGAREVDDMYKFIKKNAKSAIADKKSKKKKAKKAKDEDDDEL